MDRCKYCGSKAVKWQMNEKNRWSLLNLVDGTKHNCSEWRQRKIAVDKSGVFLRLYGPRKAPTHAVMAYVHAPDADTPRGMHVEISKEIIKSPMFHIRSINFRRYYAD